MSKVYVREEIDGRREIGICEREEMIDRRMSGLKEFGNVRRGRVEEICKKWSMVLCIVLEKR